MIKQHQFHPFIISSILFLVFLFFGCSSKSQSKLEIISIHSPSLEEAILKVDTDKKLAIYLPPSYASSNKQYPVIYYLPGFTSPIEELIDGEYEGFKLQEVLDELIQSKKIKEMIVVLCDGNNFLGGSFYTNSPLTGNFEDFIIQDVVNYIDVNYRTIKQAKSRGITGHSMGGFGAFNIFQHYTDVFSICYSMSPGIFTETGLHDMNLFEKTHQLEYLKEFIQEIQNEKNRNKAIALFKKKIKPLFSESRESYYSGFTLAYGAAFSYDSTLPFPHISIPKECTNPTNLDQETFRQWKNGFGNWKNKILENKTNFLKTSNLAFDCGKEDAWIYEGTKYITELLEDNNIPVKSYWHEGGHSDQLHVSLKERMFPYFSSTFEYTEQ